MFKNFEPKNSISGKSLVKNSVSRAIKASLVEQYPKLGEKIIESIFKNEQGSSIMYLVKCKDQMQLLMTSCSCPEKDAISRSGASFDKQNEIVFFRERDGGWIPTLALVHKHPDCFDYIQVDKGAAKFILKGSDIMDRGITSKGGLIPIASEQLSIGTPRDNKS